MGKNLNKKEIEELKNLKVRPTLRQGEKLFLDKKLDEYLAKTNMTESEKRDFSAAAQSLAESRKAIDEFHKKERFIVDTLRKGFIGNKITDMDGTEYVQISRGRPYGYFAGVYDEKTKKIYVGIAYVSPTERWPHSVIGQALALSRAIENREKGIEDDPIMRNAEDVRQLFHFKERAYRYFRPDEFSFSRGKTPIGQESFGPVHVWQYFIGMLDAKTEKERKEYEKKLLALVKPKKAVKEKNKGKEKEE